MKPVSALFAKWSDTKDSVFIGGMADWKLALLGSNLRSSVTPSQYDRVTGFTLSVPQGTKGVVAVLAFQPGRGRNSGSQEAHFFVSIDNCGEKPTVDLSNVWVPSGERIGHIRAYGYIEVQIGTNHFTTDKAEFTEGRHKEPDTYTVDGNTLVRYLVGEIEAAEVREAAQAHIREKLASEQLPLLEQMVKHLEGELTEARRLHQNCTTTALGYQDRNREFCKKLFELKCYLSSRRFPLAKVRTLIDKVNWILDIPIVK